MIEVSRSRGKREALQRRLVGLIMRWQDATQAFDAAVGERLDLSRAELHCLSFLHEAPRPTGAIATEVGLTPAAVTSLVDRLEARGLVERQRSERDRRQVLVALTQAAAKATERFYGPIAKEGRAELETFSVAELESVAKFMEAALALQVRHLRRIAGETAGPRAASKARRATPISE